MTENNGFTVIAVTDPKPSYEDLEAKLADLELKLAEMTRSRDMTYASFTDMTNTYNKVQQYIQASLDREEWSDTELQEPFWTELADLLGLEIKQERQVTVTATWVMTVKSAKDYINQWDFNVSIESDTGEIDIISGDEMPDIDVSE